MIFDHSCTAHSCWDGSRQVVPVSHVRIYRRKSPTGWIVVLLAITWQWGVCSVGGEHCGRMMIGQSPLHQCTSLLLLSSEQLESVTAHCVERWTKGKNTSFEERLRGDFRPFPFLERVRLDSTFVGGHESRQQ
ncbi:hypothetical protein EV363DRAFT_1267930 [Boletus edulis]|nr:hypothetical protein EV363DRAFT_1267930 [Boletus edulis]